MPRARNTDPQTSHDAADSVKNVTLTQAAVLKILKRPRTDPQLIEAYRKLKRVPLASESGIRTRRAELVDKGLVADTGQRATTPFGRRATVWGLAHA
jgi:hypothetical protein